MYFNVGDTGFKVFKTKFAKIGVAICWDQWFPEAARAMALQGAEVRPFPLSTTPFLLPFPPPCFFGRGFSPFHIPLQISRHRPYFLGAIEVCCDSSRDWQISTSRSSKFSCSVQCFKNEHIERGRADRACISRV